jgi:hypothetical protein
MNDEEMQEMDENFEMLYSALKRRTKGSNTMYM